MMKFFVYIFVILSALVNVTLADGTVSHVVFSTTEFENNARIFTNGDDDMVYQITSVDPEGHYMEFKDLMIFGLDDSIKSYVVKISNQTNDSEIEYELDLKGDFGFKVLSHEILDNDERRVKFAITEVNFLNQADLQVNFLPPSNMNPVPLGEDFVLSSLEMGTTYKVIITAAVSDGGFNALYRTQPYRFKTGFNLLPNLDVFMLNKTSALITWDDFEDVAVDIEIETYFTKSPVGHMRVVGTNEIITTELEEGMMYRFHANVITDKGSGEVTSVSCRTDGYGLEQLQWNNGGIVYIFRPRTDINNINWPYAIKLSLCPGAEIETETLTNCDVDDFQFQDGSNSFLVSQREEWMYETKYMAVKYKSNTESCEVSFEEFVLPILVSHSAMSENLRDKESPFYVSTSWDQNQKPSIFLVKVELSKYFYFPGEQKKENDEEAVDSLTYKPEYVRLIFSGNVKCTKFYFDHTMTTHISFLRKKVIAGRWQVILKQKEEDYYVNDLSIFFLYNKNECSEPESITVKLYWKTLEYIEPTNKEGITSRIIK